MDAQQLDAFVYPTWSHPPRLIGDLNTPHGDNSQFFSPETGFPAIQVPMGYTRGDALRVQCEARLKDAQARIEKISLGADGRPAGTEPFDGS